MKVDLVVRNAKIVTPRGIMEGGITVEEGIVVALAKDSNLPHGDKVLDVGARASNVPDQG